MGYFVDTSARNVYWLDSKMRFSFLLGASFPLAFWLHFTSNTKSNAAFIFSRTRVLPQVEITRNTRKPLEDPLRSETS